MADMVFTTTQLFNRRNVGFLWDNRAKLDKGQFEIVKSIYNNRRKSSINASQEITYRLSTKGAGKLGYGRLYGNKGSFETLEKECRGTICKEYYHDIDIVNCHPVILVQFAKNKFNTDLPEVDKYIYNREVYLNNVMTENKITRDEAKQVIIAILYGGTCNKQSFLYPLSYEVREFSKKLYYKEMYAELVSTLKSEKNKYGSFISFILQTEERHCMLAMKENLEANGWSVDVLCYDGVMIRKREDVMYDLKACEKAIEEKTGYTISLVPKELLSFEVPPINEEIVKNVSLDAYKEMKREFEENHFYHAPSDKFVEVKEDATMLFMTLPHAHQYLNSTWCFKLSEKFGDNIPFLDIWRKDPTYKVCNDISFRETDNPEIFQMPLNFAYMKDKPFTYSPRALDLFLEIVDINTSGNDILKEYSLNYFAHMLQKPFDLPGVGLVITGSKGTGKDTLGDFLQKWIVGSHLSTNYSTNKQFFDKHDMGKLNKILIKLEETSRKDCFENASELKANITAHQITCNPKGMKEITADNFARYIFTTNKPNPVDMSDEERRFVLLASSSRKRGDFNFWTEVRKVMFSFDGAKTVANYLLARDVSEFEIRKLPENCFQNSIVQSEKSAEEKFIQQWDGANTTASDLYTKYVEYCSENRLQYSVDASQFGKRLQLFVRDGIITNTHPHNVSHYMKPMA